MGLTLTHGVTRFVLVSVPEALARYADCPVDIARYATGWNRDGEVTPCFRF